jgi:hypothetical protein
MSSTQQLLLGEGAGGVIPAYIEEVYSTSLYEGNGSTQTITNGIDLSTKGGLIWVKCRNNAPATGTDHALFDSVRGVNNQLSSNLQTAQVARTGNSFNTTGFTIGLAGGSNQTNNTGSIYDSWTFREQPKFFDIVTYTGDKASGRSITHNLGSTPGCIIIKSATDTERWTVYHRSLTAGNILDLSETNGEFAISNGISSVTDSSFTIGSSDRINSTGQTFIVYLFAHDAGGFGPTGTDNAISCGSFTTSGGTATVTLGYQPQWLMVKRTDGSGNWAIYDIMMGIPTGSDKRVLFPNTTGIEINGNNPFDLTANGFNVTNAAAFPGGAGTSTYIYVTIRRGPMKIPTVGTSVFTPTAYSGNGTYNRNIDTTITPDSIWNLVRNASGPDRTEFDSLRGWPYYSLYLNLNYVEAFSGADILARPTIMNSIRIASSGTNYLNNGSYTYANYSFKRAPNFYDVVCFTGTKPTVQTVTHNLGVAPELLIVKNRGSAGNWVTWNTTIAAANAANFITLNSDYFASPDNSYFNSTAPTASVFTVGTDNDTNMAGVALVAYLFATCPGVSKVGSYTGTGALQTINCGFTSGARFVLIKRTDNLGDWFVWDSARGITAGNDPYSLINSNAAEVTGTNYVDTTSVGFQVTAAAPSGINASGGTYIFLAIA